MTPHIEAEVGDYAPIVLMPGDPLRAKWIAQTFLTDVRQVNSVRNCLGFTGLYNETPVSIQASGMGQASLGIYATELFKFYNVETIIRIGTCGSFHGDLKVGHLVVAVSSFTDSSMSSNIIPNWIFNPCCDYSLLSKVVNQLNATDTKYSVGAIASTDWFYKEDSSWWNILKDYNVLGVDMETHILYLIAMKYAKKALTVNTVSDNFETGQHMNSADRASSLHDLVFNVLESL